MSDESMPTTGRWGWYKDHEGNEFRRVSTLIQKVQTDTYHLDLWKQRQVAEGLALRNDLVLAIKAMGRPSDEGWSSEDKKKLNEIVKSAAAAAKERDGAVVGTAVHLLTERLDRGEDVEDVVRGLPWRTEADLRAYDALIKLNGWTAPYIERTVVNDDVNAAGTFDRIYEIPGLSKRLGPTRCQHSDTYLDHEATGGNLDTVIGDVKTEKDPTANGLHIGPQLAIYSRAQIMWTPGDQDYEATYVRSPCVRQDVGVVVHIHGGKAVPYFVNLNAGWDAARAAFDQMARETSAKRWLAPVPDVVEPKPAQLLVETAKAHDYGDPDRPRVNAVGSAPEELPRLTLPDPAPVTDTTMLPSITEETGGELKKSLIAEIWKATTLDRLAELWRLATEKHNVAWSGPVATAGDARQRQIECPQRALHTGTGKCACSWMPPLPA